MDSTVCDMPVKTLTSQSSANGVEIFPQDNLPTVVPWLGITSFKLGNNTKNDSTCVSHATAQQLLLDFQIVPYLSITLDSKFSIVVSSFFQVNCEMILHFQWKGNKTFQSDAQHEVTGPQQKHNQQKEA